MSQVKDKFTNKSAGTVGVVTVDSRGEHKAIAVKPDHDVWLTHEEQILTANAPRNESDNPLTNGALFLSASNVDMGSARPLRPVEPPPAPEVPEDLPPAAEAPQEPAPEPEAPAPEPEVAPEEPEAEPEVEAPAEEQTETGAAPTPAGPPPEGDFAPNEEVATPAAVAALAENAKATPAVPRQRPTRKPAAAQTA
jgi:hypothetical protein